MAIRIVRNEDGNCIEFRGSPNPVYWNACLRATTSALDANNQGTAVSTLSLQRVWWSCANGDGGDAFARLDYEDSDGDIPIITLIDSGYWDFREFGGIPANTSSNSNENDVNFVVVAAADSGNSYTCIAEFLKNY